MRSRSGYATRVTKNEQIIGGLTNRLVEYRYRGVALKLALSHGLFSSAGVDSGTHMLLAMIADSLRSISPSEVVDLGCGTGAAGIALAAAYGTALRAYDRDTLAVEFTRQNAARNKLVPTEVEPALGLPSLPATAGRLVVSNLPAKAGRPVLESMIDSVAKTAGESGWGATVIVRTLEQLLLARLQALGVAIIDSRGSANHRTVVFRGSSEKPEAGDARDVHDPGTGEGRGAGDDGLPSHYIRTRSTFEGPAHAYDLDTVYNLPEFDGLSFRTALVFDLFRGITIDGPVLIYGTGQGHLAEGCRQRMSAPHDGSGGVPHLCDRDLLALRTTAHNGHVGTVRSVPYLSAIGPGLVPDRVEWFVVNDDPIPGSDWNTDLIDVAESLLGGSGKLVLAARSTTLARFLKSAGRKLRQLDTRRISGYRADLLSLRH